MTWEPGQSGNPKGRKRSQWREHFDAAIAADTKKHKQSIFEYAIAQARKDNTLLAAILRKCLPDLKAVEANISHQDRFRLIIDLRNKDKSSSSGTKTKKAQKKS